MIVQPSVRRPETRHSAAPAPEPALEPAPLAAPRGAWARWRAPLAFVALALALSSLSWDWLSSGEGLVRLRAWQLAAGAWADAAFVAASALLVMFGLPRSLPALLAGVLFGAAEGATLAAVATLAGCAASFALVRRLDRGARRARVSRFDRALREHGFATVLALRLVPVGHCQALNVLLALSPVRPGAFLTGTALGILPQTVGVACVGAGVLTGTREPVLFGASLLLAVVALGAWWRGPTGPDGAPTLVD